MRERVADDRAQRFNRVAVSNGVRSHVDPAVAQRHAVAHRHALARPVGRSDTAAPPKPKGTTFKLVKQTFWKDPIGVTSTYRATWTEPAASATSFTVYGVADCLRYAKANDGEPCVVPGMRIPPSQLKVLATVGGDKRSVLVKWTTYGELSIDPYQAVLLSASNQYGESRSAILHSERVCYNCVY